jgi:hypothetical protein
MRQYEKHIDMGVPTVTRDPQAAKKLGAEIALLEAKLRRVSETGFTHMSNLCVFAIEPPKGTEHEVTACLEELARIMRQGEKPAKPRIRHWHDETPFDATGDTVN